MAPISFTVSAPQVNFSIDPGRIGMEVAQFARGDAPVYSGDYAVTPDFEEHILQTGGKLMAQDVTVRIIPVSKTINDKGGNTVYIGGAING